MCLDNHPCRSVSLGDALQVWEDLDGFKCRGARPQGSLLDPLLDGCIFRAIDGKAFGTLVGLLCRRLEKQETFGWIKKIDSPLTEFDRQSVVIKLGIIPPEAESKPTLAVQVSMAGAKVAAAASECRDHFAVKCHGCVGRDAHGGLGRERLQVGCDASGTRFEGHQSVRFDSGMVRRLDLPLESLIAGHIEGCTVGLDQQNGQFSGVTGGGIERLRKDFQRRRGDVRRLPA